jgi:hypothetical protein
LPATIKISVERDKGFEEDVVLNPPVGLPPGVAPPAMKPIAKGQKEVTIQLPLPAKTPLGQFFVIFSGKDKQAGKDLTVVSQPLTLDLSPQPFELQVAPTAVQLKPGQTAKLKVMAIRKGGYNGPIALEVRNLPAKVTATKGTVAMGQKEVELEIRAADDAAAISRMDVQVGGTATAFNNVANASPNFTITVEKK